MTPHAAVLLASLCLATSVSARDVPVADAAALATAIEQALPGDRI